MSTPQVVRRLVKMEIPLFMVPARVMTLGPTARTCDESAMIVRGCDLRACPVLVLRY